MQLRTQLILVLAVVSGCNTSHLNVRNVNLPPELFNPTLIVINDAAKCQILINNNNQYDYMVVMSADTIKAERKPNDDGTEIEAFFSKYAAKIVMPEFVAGSSDPTLLTLGDSRTFIQILMHELGHALLLEHADNTVMSAVFQRYQSNEDAAASLVAELQRQRSPYYESCLDTKLMLK